MVVCGCVHVHIPYTIPCSPSAEVVFALHGVGGEADEDSSGDDKSLQHQVHIKVGDNNTQRQTLKNSLRKQSLYGTHHTQCRGHSALTNVKSKM